MSRYVPLFAALVLSSFARGQDVFGSISGRVLDPSGSAVAGAVVVATQTETGAARTAKSALNGEYTFPNLPIGPYQISASHNGFKQSVEKGLVLHVSERASFDFSLQVGEMSQQVTVTSTAEQVEMGTGDQSTLISGEQVRELQLNGRSFMTLLELVPGVASNMADRTDPNSTPDVAINGSRNSASNFNIDGGNNADVIVGSGSLNTFTSVETIAEFSVITSPYSAEYGKGGFSQVNVVTKGGTKQYHGSLFYFLRNDAFAASDYLTHQTLPLKLNNFGYNIGGPLAFGRYNRGRNRTFFFWTQEFNRITNTPAAVNTTVPTALERVGDFSPLGPGPDKIFGTADDPVVDPITASGFPNGKIPASRIDPNSAKLMALYPLPNFAGPGAINYTSAVASRQNWREEMIRIDQNLTDNLRLFGRFTQDAFDLANPYGGFSLSAVTTRFAGLANTYGKRPGKNVVVNGFHTITPTLFQHFQFTFARRYFDLGPTSGLSDRQALGVTLPKLFQNGDRDIPGINLGASYAVISPYHIGHKELFNLEFSDTFTKVYRSHTIKSGALYSFGGNLEQPNNVNTGGSFAFSTNFAKNPVANFLLGYPNTYTEVEKPVVSDARFGFFEAFAQDDFKVKKNLTICYGLRYTNYYNPYDVNNVMSNFLPSTFKSAEAPQVVRATGVLVADTGNRLNGIIVAGKNSPYGNRIANNNLNLWGPRFSFAYAPFARRHTAIRGGWGLFFTRPLIGAFINNAFDNPPFSRTVTLNQPSYYLFGGSAPAQSPPTVTALGLPLKAPTVHRWSFGVQQQILRNGVLDVSYVGSRSLRLEMPVAINNPLAGTVPAGTSVNFARPYAGYGAITSRQSSGDSNYHALQVSFNRRMAKKLSVGLAYTWSKSIDDASSDRNGTDVPPNSQNFRAERGPSDFDRTQILTGNFIWSVPVVVRSPFFKGWQISGITRMWTGTPFDVVMSSDVAGIGAVENQRPDVIADTKGLRTFNQWFNVNAFARPKTGTFGNMGRNSLRGAGVNKMDLALFKSFSLTEGAKLQFRSEAFNAFNHPTFTTIGTSLNTTVMAVNPGLNSFGVVTGTRDSRVIQLALKLTF